MRVARYILLLLLVVACAACGRYSLTSRQPSVMGNGTATLKVQAVDNPTMFTWLPYTLRSSLRDEVNARRLAVWKDSGSTDYEIRLIVHSFQLRGNARNQQDETLLFTATMDLSAELYNAATNTLKWRSSRVSYSNTYEASDEQEAARELSRELLRRIVDSMRREF